LGQSYAGPIYFGVFDRFDRNCTGLHVASIPSELAEDIAGRIRAAAEMGDVTTLNAIAEEIKDQSDSCAPLSKQIVQMADDFELDGIIKLAAALNAG
jgi:hypothetical protein